MRLSVRALQERRQPDEISKSSERPTRELGRCPDAHRNIDLVVCQTLDHLTRPGWAWDDDKRLAAVLLGELEEWGAEMLGHVADALAGDTGQVSVR